jgi:hypothetical protein
LGDTRIPIALIVDDPPVNSTYWLRRQAHELGILRPASGDFGKWVADWPAQEPSKIIPNAFWVKFIRWASQAGVRGKFTLLPCPAGQGFIDDQVAGYSGAELSELVSLVREEYTRQFDITPEILTHSMAWDLKERRILPIWEHQWMSQQTEQVLTDYMAEGLRVLKNVGIMAHGVTQPCNFGGDEALYARAVLAAVKRVHGVSRAFYFLTTDGDSLPVRSPVVISDAARGEYVVSVASGVRGDEPFWASLYGGGDVVEMAEYFISADGQRGRLVDLLRSGGPVIFHCHGQTIFSNGSERGFQSLQLVIERVNRHLGPRVQWMNMREFVEHTIAAK